MNISNPDKVLFPDSGITKAELVDYYRRVAPAMLPHVRGRPLTLQRFPDGIEGSGFMQKEASSHFPDFVGRATVPKQKGEVTHAIADRADALMYLAGQGTITFHVWLSRADRPHNPDRMAFDLDPSGDDFGVVKDAALAVRTVLDELGLVPFVETTGSRGLHVVTPLDRRADTEEVHAFSSEVARLVASRDPERFTTEFHKAARKGRLYLDVARNGYAQHMAAPYSVRALPGAPVVTALEWDELDDPDIGPRRFTIADVPKRIEDIGDPWAGIGRRARGLSGPRRRLQDLAA